MSYRTLMAIGAVALLIAAATAIDTQHVVWQPSWPVRLIIGGVGVLLAFGARLVGGPPQSSPKDDTPDA